MIKNNNHKGRLIIVDPSLKDTRGHHYELTRLIVDSAINSGFESVVFSNRSADNLLEMAGARVEPVFSMSTYDYCKRAQKKDEMSLKQKLHLAFSLRCPESIKVILRKLRGNVKTVLAKIGVQAGSVSSGINYDMLNELLEAMLKEAVTCEDHVLVHTADAMIYRLLLQLLQKKYPLGDHPCFHICTPYDMRVMPHVVDGIPVEKVITYLKLMGLINKTVFLYAENQLLADSLTDTWGVEVSPLDIPVDKNKLQTTKQYRDDAVLRVVYLGAAREEKGFHLLPDVIAAVLKKVKSEFRVEFVIQCSPQITGYTAKIEAAVKKLQELSGDNVRLIKSQQSNSQYHSILENSDVVLCCYQEENYRVRGSGVATEAVAYGKTIIATPGTYPEWLAGDAGCSAVGCKEIMAAILSIMNNRNEYHNKALKRAEWFIERTRPDEYVNKLLAREEAAQNNLDSVSKGQAAKISQELEKEVVVAENYNDFEDHDAAGHENKYNAGLSEAVTSSDGKVLFIKQISK